MSSPPTAFLKESPTARVVFGAGVRMQLADEVGRLGGRPMLFANPRRPAGKHALTSLGSSLIAHLGDLPAHVPATAAALAVEQARATHADCLVAVGGGSAIGMAKIIARELHLPILAMPTTYSGSEMSPIWGLTDGGVKRTGRDPAVLPRVVLYDPELTLDLPTGVSANSAMNALAHLVEAGYSPDATPSSLAAAQEGIAAIAGSLPGVVTAPKELGPRSGLLYGAWLAGSALGTCPMGVHHKLCHVLGGSFGLPHAQTHSALLPYVAAANATAAPKAMMLVVEAFAEADREADHAPGALWDLRAETGAAAELSSLGLTPADVPAVVAAVLGSPPPNPRVVEGRWLSAVLHAGLEGARPEANI